MSWQAEAAESQKAVKVEQSRGIGSILNSRAESTSGKLITREVTIKLFELNKQEAGLHVCENWTIEFFKNILFKKQFLRSNCQMKLPSQLFQKEKQRLFLSRAPKETYT